MMTQALMISCLGMAGVFFFLFLLICSMNLLQCLDNSAPNKLKTVAAIAVALKNKQ